MRRDHNMHIGSPCRPVIYFISVRVGVMFWKFSKHHEKVVRFFINERKWMKIRWFSEEFRSLPTITEDFRKNRRCFEHISYISQSPESRVRSPESRVQSPESRVQSPVQSPVLVLDYAALSGHFSVKDNQNTIAGQYFFKKSLNWVERFEYLVFIHCLLFMYWLFWPNGKIISKLNSHEVFSVTFNQNV